MRSSYTFPNDAHLLTLMPHMHVRGKDFLYKATYPDGRSEVLLSVPPMISAGRASTSWPSRRRCPGGRGSTAWPTSTTRPATPTTPTRRPRSTWGDQTWDEMMIGYIDYYEDAPAATRTTPIAAQTRPDFLATASAHDALGADDVTGRQAPPISRRGGGGPPVEYDLGPDDRAGRGDEARRAMRVSLFITCFNDTLFPQTGRAMVRLLERLGHTVEFPAGPDLLRADALQHRIPARGDPVGAAVRRGLRRGRGGGLPSASCVGMVRELYPHAAELAATPTLAERSGAGAAGLELSEFLVHTLGVEDVGAYYPHRVTYHPTCHSLRMLRVGDAPAATAAGGPRDRPGRAAAGRGVLRLRRHVRRQERRHVDGHARRQAPLVLDTRAEVCAAADNSCLMHIGGALHRQRAGVGAIHLAEILAATEDDNSPSTAEPDQEHPDVDCRAVAHPARRPLRGGGQAALANTQLRRNMGKATQTIRAKRQAVVAGAARLGGAARGRPRRSRSASLRHLDTYLIELEAAVDAGRRAWSTGRATPPRPMRSSPGSSPATERARWSRSSR